MFLINYPSIVALHYVSDDEQYDSLKPWVISHTTFLRLLDYLEAEHYTTVLTKDVVEGYIPPKAVMITFDDCPKHLFDFAIPELLKRNMRAVFFMPTAYLGGCNEWGVEGGMPRLELMDESDMKRLTDIGMEVGSHAHDHVMLTDFDKKFVQEQMTRSKKILEQITQKTVLSVAYPYGFVPAGYKTIVKKAGYKLGLSVETIYDSKYALRRWVLVDEDDALTISKKMSDSYNVQRSFTDKADIISRKILSRMYLSYKKVKNMFLSFIGLGYVSVDILSEYVIMLQEDMTYIMFL